MRFKYVTIDQEQNKLLCSTELVGKGEIAEVYQLDTDSPPQASSRILQKVADPNVFAVLTSFDGSEALGRKYVMGTKCIFRILAKNQSGKKRRKFSGDENTIVDTYRDQNVPLLEKKVSKAKTGSVRKRM